jgi:hypothetical protein
MKAAGQALLDRHMAHTPLYDEDAADDLRRYTYLKPHPHTNDTMAHTQGHTRGIESTVARRIISRLRAFSGQSDNSTSGISSVLPKPPRVSSTASFTLAGQGNGGGKSSDPQNGDGSSLFVEKDVFAHIGT